MADLSLSPNKRAWYDANSSSNNNSDSNNNTPQHQSLNSPEKRSKSTVKSETGTTALASLTIDSPIGKAYLSSSYARTHTVADISTSLQSSPKTPKSDFHAYAESALSPLNLGSIGSISQPQSVTRIPTSHEWSPYVNQVFGIHDEFNGTFSDSASSPPPRMRHKIANSTWLLPSPTATSTATTAGTSSSSMHRSKEFMLYNEALGGKEYGNKQSNQQSGSSSSSSSNSGGSNNRYKSNNKNALSRTSSGSSSMYYPTSPAAASLSMGASPYLRLGIAEQSWLEDDNEDGLAVLTAALASNNDDPNADDEDTDDDGSSSLKEQEIAGSTSHTQPAIPISADAAPCASSSSSTKRLNSSATVTDGATTTATNASAVDKTVHCNCKKSRCLKLYCDCFRISKYCDGCNCHNCSNLLTTLVERNAAIAAIIDRNPDAFLPRVQPLSNHANASGAVATADSTTDSHTDADAGSSSSSGVLLPIEKGHLSGCHCKKSACLKKYCECFTGSAPCTDKCRCVDCKNIADLYTKSSSTVPLSATGAPACATGATVKVNSTKKSKQKSRSSTVTSSSSSTYSDSRSNSPKQNKIVGVPPGSPIATLLDLAGICAQQEATESLLALSPKPSLRLSQDSGTGSPMPVGRNIQSLFTASGSGSGSTSGSISRSSSMNDN